jgi:hypothetical protein
MWGIVIAALRCDGEIPGCTGRADTHAAKEGEANGIGSMITTPLDPHRAGLFFCAPRDQAAFTFLTFAK